MGPILKDLERLFQNSPVLGGYLEQVNGLIESRIGIEFRAVPHADGLQVINNLLFFKILSAVKGHVLHEMGQSLLVIILQHRSGINHQSQLSPVFRLKISVNIVG
ncbi:hypothetical protein ES703_70334 [subsurface metagenome]